MSVVAVVLRVVAAVLAVIALILGVRVVLALLFNSINPENSLVELVVDLSDPFVGFFEGLFDFDDPRFQVAVNFGLAALVYLLLAGVCNAVAGRLGSRRTTTKD